MPLGEQNITLGELLRLRPETTPCRGGGWICAMLHPNAPNSERSQEESWPAPHALGLSAPGHSSSSLTRLTRKRNRERGYIFVPCIGPRDVLWYTLRWLDETTTDGDPSRLGAVLGA